MLTIGAAVGVSAAEDETAPPEPDAALNAPAASKTPVRPTPNEPGTFHGAVRGDVLPWLEEQPTYAGAWLDHETGQLVVLLTEPDPWVIAEIDARVPDGRNGWRLYAGDYPQDVLIAAVERAIGIGGDLPEDLPGVGRLEASSLDTENNRVELRFERGAIKDLAAAEEAWQETLGVPVSIWREVIAPSERLPGRWEKVPQAPWATAYGPAVAVDGHMLVLDPETGRVLRFDPDSGKWTRRARAPQGFEASGPWVWTGDELVAFDGWSSDTYALDLKANEWRRLPPSPLIRHSLAVWADGRIFVAWVGWGDDEGKRSLALYDQAAEAWTQLPAPTGSTDLVGLYWTGSELLAVTSDEYQDLVQVAAFDPTAGVWSEPVSGPLSWWHSGANWVDDRLVFAGNDEYFGPADASFDPRTMDWTTETFDCPLSTGAAVWTGELLISTNDRYALDPESGDCYRFPGRPRTANGNAVIWTGDRVIYWSGGGAEEGHPDPYRYGGHAFVFDPE